MNRQPSDALVKALGDALDTEHAEAATAVFNAYDKCIKELRSQAHLMRNQDSETMRYLLHVAERMTFQGSYRVAMARYMPPVPDRTAEDIEANRAEK